MIIKFYNLSVIQRNGQVINVDDNKQDMVTNPCNLSSEQINVAFYAHKSLLCSLKLYSFLAFIKLPQ